MKTTELQLIVAIARNGVIGRAGGLPWRLSSDLRRFKRLTMGGALIVGRKTYDSIGRPLPGRQMIVVTRQVGLEFEGVTVVGSLDQALHSAADAPQVFCAGGAEIYRLGLPEAARLHVTWVEAEVEGDVRFPEIDWDDWQVASEIRLPAGERDEYPTTFREYRRVHGPTELLKERPRDSSGRVTPDRGSRAE